MTHLAEDSTPLEVKYISAKTSDDLLKSTRGFSDTCILRLPACAELSEYRNPLQGIGKLIAEVAERLGPEATLITLGEVIDLVQVQADMPSAVRYQHWIVIKRSTHRASNDHSLHQHHFGALVHTRYMASLRHAKTRIAYTYCPSCDKTTKDYGGKKHTYHEYGTLMSDVWRDIDCDFEGDISSVITRFADFFGIASYSQLLVVDCRSIGLKRIRDDGFDVDKNEENEVPRDLANKVIEGDCLHTLQNLPDNSIDFAFADPPYNLGKGYVGYTDDLETKEYFAWCNQWISELVRVLKPGRTCAILNIPIRAVQHFLYMRTALEFQHWIVWDALAFPVRLIMPAHYTVLCFSKGPARELSALSNTRDVDINEGKWLNQVPHALKPLAEDYCLRSSCVQSRHMAHIDDRGPLTDLWGDIHRLKHNSRRVDHPCQLPPTLMHRLISAFTNPGETVLDCFNGAGTTTLAAAQLGRRFIGIEASNEYCEIAKERHQEMLVGLNPFRKKERALTAKNSPVPRLKKQHYVIPKKTLQLEVRRVAETIGHVPTREELIAFGEYPIEYYDSYFISWGEVCAAARTTGMTENRIPVPNDASASTKAGYRLSLSL